MSFGSRIAALCVVTFLCACGDGPPPLYEGLGLTGQVITLDASLSEAQASEAQDYFDQGLALCWGFNHDEALRAFEHVADLDPDCAMAWWGIAYVLGPDINGPLEDAEIAREGHAAAQRALTLAEAEGATVSDIERALIEALTTRFADPPPEDRAELEVAYAEAMREVWKRFPDDALVGTLFADALMNINQDWRALGADEERGAYTPEIVATLERVLAAAPDHAGANHFYIHAVEASDRPERGLPSAGKLEGLMPAAGHMVHMPSHIYVRLGMYDEAVEANARAVIEDDRFFAQAPRQNVYHFYRAHNHHFLAWTAMFRGSYADAMAAARDMVGKLPEGSVDEYPGMEAFRFVPMHVLMRFGRWEQMLAEPQPDEDMAIATSLWHHARAVALANTGRLAEAREEAAKFETVAATIPDTVVVRKAHIDTLMEVARHMMTGEILFKEGDRAGGIAALRKGVEAEDSMPYAEPPSWMQPVRHSLGALLLEDGRVEEAQAVYRADLDRHAHNVWSLHGLAECLRKSGRDEEAEAIEARYAEMSAQADVKIRGSCFCRTAES